EFDEIVEPVFPVVEEREVFGNVLEGLRLGHSPYLGEDGRHCQSMGVQRKAADARQRICGRGQGSYGVASLGEVTRPPESLLGAGTGAAYPARSGRGRGK